MAASIDITACPSVLGMRPIRLVNTGDRCSSTSSAKRRESAFFLPAAHCTVSSAGIVLRDPSGVRMDSNGLPNNSPTPRSIDYESIRAAESLRAEFAEIVFGDGGNRRGDNCPRRPEPLFISALLQEPGAVFLNLNTRPRRKRSTSRRRTSRVM